MQQFLIAFIIVFVLAIILIIDVLVKMVKILRTSCLILDSIHASQYGVRETVIVNSEGLYMNGALDFTDELSEAFKFPNPETARLHIHKHRKAHYWITRSVSDI